MATPGRVLIQRSRMACSAVAVGPFTPIALERYEFIGGETGMTLGYPSETVDGHSCIIWDMKADACHDELCAIYGCAGSCINNH